MGAMSCWSSVGTCRGDAGWGKPGAYCFLCIWGSESVQEVPLECIQHLLKQMKRRKEARLADFFIRPRHCEPPSPARLCVRLSVLLSHTSSASERSAAGEVGGNTLFSFLLPFGISVPAAELLCFSETPFPTARSVTLPKPACPSLNFFTFQGRHLCIFFFLLVLFASW